MILSLSENNVAKVFNMAAGLRVVEESVGQHAAGESMLIPRVSQNLPGGVAFRVMPAAMLRTQWFGLKTLTGYPGRRLPGEMYFTLLLFEGQTGALRALIAGTYLTGIRTGAATGVAAKYLAKQSADILGIFGAGAQAKYQVAALIAVRPITLVKVFDPDRAKATYFAAWVVATFGIEALAVATPREAVSGCELVVTVTTASEPVFSGEWLDPGTHISGVGANTPKKRELDAETFRRSKIVVDSKDQIAEEAGDLLDAIKNGVITSSQVDTELGDLIIGRRVVRTSEDDITLFKSVGIAVEDIASAAYVYEEAKKQGIGTQLALTEGELPNIHSLAAGEALQAGPLS
jgi:alanine dehydrogenase